MHRVRRLSLFVPALLLASSTALAAQINGAPDRRPGEGEGPFDRLIIRGVYVIDGTGAPPFGPADIVIEGNRIESITVVGTPNVAIDEDGRPTGATRVIEAEGSFVLPGFVNLHAHAGDPRKAPDAEYTYKLWMANGITTVRGVALGEMDWAINEQRRSAANEIVAPRIFNYQRPGSGREWREQGRRISTPQDARDWVRYAAGKGIDGMKLGSYRPEIMAALLDEARQHGLGSTAHLAQTGVAQMNAIDAARLGLGTVTHFYGIFEALYKDNDVQPWPPDFIYNEEQHRFSQVAYQWNLIHEQGSEEWNALLEEFLELGTILDPTMVAYLASRDVMRARNADWHVKHTLPSLWDFYTASRTDHGSYYYDWTPWEENAWKQFYLKWFALLDDYKDMGGRVTVSDDAAYIYNLWGFGVITEMELLQEAGFHPLEVFRGATMHGAQALFEPKGEEIQFGVLREGLLADMVIVDENPVQNIKVLYGTGWDRLNDATGQVERIGGIRYTIKDGIVYDAKALLADVARMVEEQKKQRGVSDGSPTPH
ncbi:MAG: amidohydrolase [Gemmatimonadetes bacterium]|nr:amidohydrolase [Gemmatimonadota bacterium]